MTLVAWWFLASGHRTRCEQSSGRARGTHSVARPELGSLETRSLKGS
jgi:hypothetical protein